MNTPASLVFIDEQHIKFRNRFEMLVKGLNVREGEFLSIVGPSGAGKTTLLQLIAGIADIPDERVFRTENLSVGFMFQGDAWFDWMTVEANLRHALLLSTPKPPRLESSIRIDDALRNVGLFPRKFRPRILGSLSTGEKRRVSLAAVLIQRPKLMLLDEPTSNFDFVLKAEIQALIARIWQAAYANCAFAVVTHDIEEAVLLGTRVLCVDGGKIVLDKALKKPNIELGELRNSQEIAGYCQEIKQAFNSHSPGNWWIMAPSDI